VKPVQLLAALLICALLSVSCSRKDSRAKEQSGPPQTGGLYSLNDGEGGFRVGKIVAAENDVVFLHLFSERWASRPTLETARLASVPAPLAYTTESFAGMQPLHLESAAVSPEELEAYETWKKSNQDVF